MEWRKTGSKVWKGQRTVTVILYIISDCVIPDEIEKKKKKK